MYQVIQNFHIISINKDYNIDMCIIKNFFVKNIKIKI